MTRVRGSGETAHIIEAMKAAGNSSIIEHWKTMVAEWAQMHRTDADAAAVNAWLPFWQSRPFYTAEELAPMWPALAIITGYTTKWPARQSLIKSPAQLEHELDYHGLPRLRVPWRKFFIVERLHYWKKDASHQDIAREMKHAFG